MCQVARHQRIKKAMDDQQATEEANSSGLQFDDIVTLRTFMGTYSRYLERSVLF